LCLKEYNIILASKSPRRQELLKSLNIDFSIADIKDVKEDYPKELKADEIALSLSKLKAEAYQTDLKEKDILITADTIVWNENEVLNKPKDKEEAFTMLKKLSDKSHWVYTGVTISSTKKQKSFVSATKVFFNNLLDEEINYYIENYKPFDKAGAYGIQEWIGFVAVNRIEGSYLNVIGLPVNKLYLELFKFIK
jgi:septum formation protein